MSKSYSFYALITLIMMIACDRSEEELIDFSDCFENVVTDSSILVQSLPGDWELIGVTCGLCSESPNLDDFNGQVIVSFNANGSFIIHENGQIAQTGTWEIDENSRIVVNVESFELGARFSYFPVPAILCGNRMISDSSPSDGFGFFYQRMDN